MHQEVEMNVSPRVRVTSMVAAMVTTFSIVATLANYGLPKDPQAAQQMAAAASAPTARQ